MIFEWPANTATIPLPESAPKSQRLDSVVGLKEEYPGGPVITLSKGGRLVAYDVLAAYMASQENPQKAESSDKKDDENFFVSKTIIGSVDLLDTVITQSTDTKKDKKRKEDLANGIANNDLGFMSLDTHPSQPGVLAIGGNEYELQVYGTDWAAEKDTDKLTLLWEAKNVKKDTLGLRVPVWIESIFFLEDQASKQPVNRDEWSLLDDRKSFKLTTKIATVTHHGEVRIYDPVQRQRPITRFRLTKADDDFLSIAAVGKVDFNIPKSAIKKVQETIDDLEENKKNEDDIEEDEELYTTTPTTLLVTDRKSSTYVVNITDNTKLSMAGKLHGSMGSVDTLAHFYQKEENMHFFPKYSYESLESSSDYENASSTVPQYVVAGCLDRYVRVYDPTTRKQLGKIYTGTRPTGIVVLDGFEKDGGYDGETEERVKRQREEEEDNLLWSKLGNAEDEDNKKQKKQRVK